MQAVRGEVVVNDEPVTVVAVVAVSHSSRQQTVQWRLHTHTSIGGHNRSRADGFEEGDMYC